MTRNVCARAQALDCACFPRQAMGEWQGRPPARCSFLNSLLTEIAPSPQPLFLSRNSRTRRRSARETVCPAREIRCPSPLPPPASLRFPTRRSSPWKLSSSFSRVLSEIERRGARAVSRYDVSLTPPSIHELTNSRTRVTRLHVGPRTVAARGSRCGKRCRALVVAPTRDCRSARDHPQTFFTSFFSFLRPPRRKAGRPREPVRHRLVSNCLGPARARLSRSPPPPAHRRRPGALTPTLPARLVPRLSSVTAPRRPRGRLLSSPAASARETRPRGECAPHRGAPGISTPHQRAFPDLPADSDRPEPRREPRRTTPCGERTSRTAGRRGHGRGIRRFDHPEVSAAARRAVALPRALETSRASTRTDGEPRTPRIRFAVAAAEPRLVAVVSCDELDGMANVTTRPRRAAFWQVFLVSLAPLGAPGRRRRPGTRVTFSAWCGMDLLSGCGVGTCLVFRGQGRGDRAGRARAGERTDRARVWSDEREMLWVPVRRRGQPGTGGEARGEGRTGQQGGTDAAQGWSATRRRSGRTDVRGAERCRRKTTPKTGRRREGRTSRRPRGVSRLCFCRNGVEMSGRLDGLVDSLNAARLQLPALRRARNAGEKRRLRFTTSRTADSQDGSMTAHVSFCLSVSDFVPDARLSSPGTRSSTHTEGVKEPAEHGSRQVERRT